MKNEHREGNLSLWLLAACCLLCITGNCTKCAPPLRNSGPGKALGSKNHSGGATSDVGYRLSEQLCTNQIPGLLPSFFLLFEVELAMFCADQFCQSLVVIIYAKLHRFFYPIRTQDHKKSSGGCSRNSSQISATVSITMTITTYWHVQSINFSQYHLFGQVTSCYAICGERLTNVYKRNWVYCLVWWNHRVKQPQAWMMPSIRCSSDQRNKIVYCSTVFLLHNGFFFSFSLFILLYGFDSINLLEGIVYQQLLKLLISE